MHPAWRNLGYFSGQKSLRRMQWSLCIVFMMSCGAVSVSGMSDGTANRRQLQQMAEDKGEGAPSTPSSSLWNVLRGGDSCCRQLEEIGFESTLPVVILKAPSEIKHKVDQDIEICTCGNGANFEDYSGPAQAAGRGSSSAFFEKKSFKIELKENDGTKQNFAFLGMPEDDDWILYGPELDQTQGMRNYLTFKLARDSGNYASRTVYVEVFLWQDGSESLSMDHYNGIYLAMEKMVIKNSRLDISDLKEDDLTGGYLLVYDNDNYEGDDVLVGPISPDWDNPFVVKDPDEAPDNFEYITKYLQDFDAALKAEDWKEKYLEYIDLNAFIDYFLLVELTKNPDAYRGSTYLYKDKQKGLAMGPAWDYNEAYGMCCGFPIEGYNDAGQSGPGISGGSAISPEGWRFNICEDPERCLEDPTDGVSPWYRRMWQDESFQQATVDRWKELRSGPWSNEAITEIISTAENSIADAVQRNDERWGDALKTYGWDEWSVEVEKLRTWVIARAEWMDEELSSISGNTSEAIELEDLRVSSSETNTKSMESTSPFRAAFNEDSGN